MNRTQAAEKAKELVSRMTLEEKISQMLYQAPAIPRLGIPAYNWWNEALHGVARSGVATMFPQAIGMAAMFDEKLLEQLGDAAATEGRAKYNEASGRGDRGRYKGLTFWSPNVNIFRDPRWGRGHETYGEDPYLTSRLGVSYVHGLQGRGEGLKAAACAKHFAVHSGPEQLRHHFDAISTPKDLEETYLPAFEACVREGEVESVMGAYNRVNGEPSCASRYLLEETLRGRWKFQGHVVSDCGAIADFHNGHMVTDSPAESAALAVKMGCDLNCGQTFAHLSAALQQGLVSEEDITCSVERLMTTRYLLGILGEGTEYDRITMDEVECPAHLELASRAALESCVLLKNDGLLPLNRDSLGTLAVIGPNANSRHALIGNYHGTSSRYITVLEGIQEAMEGHGRVLYAQGSHLFRDSIEDGQEPEDGVSEALAAVRRSDAVVLVVGLDETLEGEQGDANNAWGSGDKPDLMLPRCQRLLMERVLAEGKPTVVLLMSGSAVDLKAEKAGAVMEVWYPGARGGRDVARLLFGEVSPSGKLPVTFYHNEALDEMPDFTDYSMKNRTYRYYEGTPLYPFGYGLTYGDAAVTGLEADRRCARVTAVNQGKTDTEEVVQLYIRDNASSDAPLHPVLCGFRRIALAAGETKTVEISMDPRAFTVVNEAGERIPGSGSWTLYAGMGQPDALTEKLTGHPAVSVELN